MKCIILCCDKYHIFAYHTIKTYEKLYPQNEFIYHIPYNEIKPIFIEKEFPKKIVFIKTPQPFKDTIRYLLKGSDDNDWIYWCSSDQYLINIDATIAKKINDVVKNIKDEKIYGVSFAYLNKTGEKLLKKNGDIIEKNGLRLAEKLSWESSKEITIWFHQYLRVKVLRHIFDKFEEPKVAKSLDKQLYLNKEDMYGFLKTGKYFTLDYKICEFGENTSRGMMTKNACENFQKYGIQKPSNFEVSDKE